MAAEIVVDVSELEPPEPLVLTLEAARQLEPGQYVRMLHRREPHMLYRHLAEDHFSYFRREGTAVAVEVFIWREHDNEAAASVQAKVGEPISPAS